MTRRDLITRQHDALWRYTDKLLKVAIRREDIRNPFPLPIINEGHGIGIEAGFRPIKRADCC